MAAATRHLGFGVTANLTYEQPYPVRAPHVDARPPDAAGASAGTSSPAISTARRAPIGLTRPDGARRPLRPGRRIHGRWSTSCGKAAGKTAPCCATARAASTPTRPRCTRCITHGKQYKVDAMHLSEPSPQRTPVLYQAGSSARGSRFAATHAECVFVNGQSKAGVREDRRRHPRPGGAARAARPTTSRCSSARPSSPAAPTREAQEKFAEYRRYASSEAALVHAAASMGIDFAQVRHRRADRDRQEPGDRLQRRGDDAQRRPAMDAAQAARPDGARQPPAAAGRLGRTASPTQLIGWTEEADVDGFNLSRTVVPECFDDFIELVVPLLQERGAYKTRVSRRHAARKAVRPCPSAVDSHGRSSPPACAETAPATRRTDAVMRVLLVPECGARRRATTHRSSAEATCSTSAPFATPWPGSAPPSTSSRAMAPRARRLHSLGGLRRDRRAAYPARLHQSQQPQQRGLPRERQLCVNVLSAEQQTLAARFATSALPIGRTLRRRALGAARDRRAGAAAMRSRRWTARSNRSLRSARIRCSSARSRRRERTALAMR